MEQPVVLAKDSFSDIIINLPYLIRKLASRSLPCAVHEIKKSLIFNSISLISFMEIVLLDWYIQTLDSLFKVSKSTIIIYKS